MNAKSLIFVGMAISGCGAAFALTSVHEAMRPNISAQSMRDYPAMPQISAPIVRQAPAPNPVRPQSPTARPAAAAVDTAPPAKRPPARQRADAPAPGAVFTAPATAETMAFLPSGPIPNPAPVSALPETHSRDDRLMSISKTFIGVYR